MIGALCLYAISLPNLLKNLPPLSHVQRPYVSLCAIFLTYVHICYLLFKNQVYSVSCGDFHTGYEGAMKFWCIIQSPPTPLQNKF